MKNLIKKIKYLLHKHPYVKYLIYLALGIIVYKSIISELESFSDIAHYIAGLNLGLFWIYDKHDRFVEENEKLVTTIQSEVRELHDSINQKILIDQNMSKTLTDELSNLEKKQQLLENNFLIPICESCELPVYEKEILGGIDEDACIICENCCNTPNIVSYVSIAELFCKTSRKLLELDSIIQKQLKSK